MPTDRDTNVYDMFVRVLGFDAEHSSDYATIPAAAGLLADVLAAKEALDGYFADQASGERAAAVELQTVRLAAARRKMRRYTKAARAIGLETPGFDELFKMPKSEGIDETVAAGRDFVKQAATHAAELTALGVPTTLRTALAADLDAIEVASTAKAAALGDTVAATAGIEMSVAAGMKAAKKLDVIMTNVYDEDPVMLAEWRTARHVKRANQPDPTPPTP